MHFQTSLEVHCYESACQHKGQGFDPWSGKIPHAAGQQACIPQLLSLCARALKLHNCGAQLLKSMCPRAHFPQQEKPSNEKSAHN